MEIILRKTESPFEQKLIAIIDIITGKYRSYFVDSEGHLLEIDSIIAEYSFPWEERTEDFFYHLEREHFSSYKNINWYNK